MNGKVYDRVIDQYKDAETEEERQRCMWNMICTIGTNHLPHIEEAMTKLDKKLNKRITLLFCFLAVVLLLMVAQNPESLQYIVRLIGGIF